MATVELVSVAHYFEEGSRGMRGGASKHDKIWGLARVNGMLVRFWGRRNSTPSVMFEGGMEAGRKLLGEKLDKGYRALGPKTVAELCPGLERMIASRVGA